MRAIWTKTISFGIVTIPKLIAPVQMARIASPQVAGWLTLASSSTSMP